MLFSPIRRVFRARTPEGGPREVQVRVLGGYVPNTIYAEMDRPIRIVFRRKESSACSEQVVIPAFGKSATLPEGEPVAIDLLPTAPGTYEFTCAMGMLHGRIVVSPPRVPDPCGAHRRAADLAASEEQIPAGGGWR